MKAHEPGVPPLAFVQLLNSDALEPDAVAHELLDVLTIVDRWCGRG